MKSIGAAVVLAAIWALPALADAPCAADALGRAGALLRLHVEGEGMQLAPAPGPLGEDGSLMPWSLSDTVTDVPPVKALVGKGRFDVLEVEGFVYKATYRMRFLYAQIPDACVLMGQEIIEVSDPY